MNNILKTTLVSIYFWYIYGRSPYFSDLVVLRRVWTAYRPSLNMCHTVVFSKVFSKSWHYLFFIICDTCAIKWLREKRRFLRNSVDQFCSGFLAGIEEDPMELILSVVELITAANFKWLWKVYGLHEAVGQNQNCAAFLHLPSYRETT